MLTANIKLLFKPKKAHKMRLFLWVFYEFFMGFLWVFYRFFIGFLWVWCALRVPVSSCASWVWRALRVLVCRLLSALCHLKW